MRVLFVCTDADIGGAERLLATLGAHWEPTDTVRLVVLMQPGTLSDRLEEAFGDVVYLHYPSTSRNLPGMVRSLEKQIRDFTPDIVSSHLFHADLVTALSRTRVPKTTTMHTQKLTSNDHPLTRIIARAVGVLSFRFRAVIPSSNSMDMRQFMASLRIKNVVAPILNGAEMPISATFDSAARSFVSVARNHPVKGHRILFAAFRQVAEQYPDWALQAWGPGIDPDDQAMQDAIAEAGAQNLLAECRIMLRGATSNPEKALAGGAALVISSIYGESFPIIGAEAAGSGIPVITTDNGNCAEFADDSRFLVKPNDSADLARAMSVFASMSDDERLELSKRARQRAEERYAPSHVVEQYRALFCDLIDSHRGQIHG